MRKLASVQTVADIAPICGADKIELASILGWKCVIPRGQMQIGERVVYFEVDSFLPVGDKRWDFLEKSSYKKNEIMGEGYRIKTQKFRGQISQGLALPLTMFPELGAAEELAIGTDVSDILGVRKWEMPEVVGTSGTILGEKPFGIPTTDETRVQSDDSLRQQLLGKKYYITTKMDGTSCTMYYINGKFGVCGRNYEYKDDGKCDMWKFAHDHKLPEKLAEIGQPVVLQGEFCGPGIQKNRLKLTKPEWYIFNYFILDENMNFHLEENWKTNQLCTNLGLKVVPVEDTGLDFEYTLEELLEKAHGKYPSGCNKEGIVVRPLCTDEYSEILGKTLSFKVLNNDYLLKE